MVLDLVDNVWFSKKKYRYKYKKLHKNSICELKEHHLLDGVLYTMNHLYHILYGLVLKVYMLKTIMMI